MSASWPVAGDGLRRGLGESGQFPTSVKEVCATIVHVVYPVEPGWESEDCPIGQPPDPIPNGTGDKSRVEQRRRKKRR